MRRRDDRLRRPPRGLEGRQHLLHLALPPVAQRRFEHKLLGLCRPERDRVDAVGKRCRRVEQFIKQLFVFVADPTVPATNNLAERDLRHQVAVRKISGGTCSSGGTATRVALATLFGIWRKQGRNPFHECRRLLTAQV